MKVIVDVCLSPSLVEGLKGGGHEADHWSRIGHVQALDSEILQWALENDRLIVTHDLDFNTLLYRSTGVGPSVIVVREQDTSPETILQPLLRVLKQFETELQEGALISMGRSVARIRRLPLR